MPRLVLPARHCQAQALAGGAVVEISEIMYDPKDTDTNAGGEWIEIHNTDSQIIDLTQWIFFDNDTNHKITADNSIEVPAGGYAVISSNLEYFKSFFANYSGLLFKTSFSLNDGEPLAIKSNKDAAPSDSVTYSSDWGAKNDGNSLQKISGQWKVGAPTPGVANVASSNTSNDNPPTDTPTGEQSSNTSQTSSTGAGEKPPEMKIEIVANKTVVVGADALLAGKALGADGKPLDNVRFLWNFGDGETREGQNVLHRFRFPSEYIVTLDIAYGKWSSTARATITAVKSPLTISRIEEGPAGFVEIANGGNTELDLFGWYLKSGNTSFLIPKNTIIGGGKKIIFPSEVTKLDAVNVLLLYPNGVTAVGYEKPAPDPAPPPEKIIETKIITPPAKPVSFPESDSGNSQVKPAKTEIKEEIAAVYKAVEGAEITKIAEATPENSGGLGIWLLALGGLIVLSLGALAFTKHKPSLIPNETEEYKIIE